MSWCRETRQSFLPCNIYQHRPGNDIFFTFTLVLSHKGQGGDVAAACALNDVFRSSNSALSWKFYLFIFFKVIRLDRKSAPQRGERGLNVQWKDCISSTLLPEPNSSTVMWANGLTHLKQKGSEGSGSALTLISHLSRVSPKSWDKRLPWRGDSQLFSANHQRKIIHLNFLKSSLLCTVKVCQNLKTFLYYVRQEKAKKS